MAVTYLYIGMDFDDMGASPVVVQADQIIPKTHEYLFHFLDADLSRLDAYGRAYLSCLETNAQPDLSIIQRLLEELFALHPFFRSCPANATATLNHCFADYIVARWPNDIAMQQTAMEKVYVDRYLSGTNLDHWLEYACSAHSIHVFERLHRLQERSRRWVFVTLDNSNPDMAKLTGAQRNAMYCLLYSSQYTPLLETKVEKTMRMSHNMQNLSVRLDFEDGYREQIDQGLEQLRSNSTETPQSVLDMIQAISQMTEDCECHTYVIEQLEDLINHEIYDMTMTDTRIKRCKYCGRYFVTGKSNAEYCDRIATGESKPCNEIGKIRTYEQKIAKGGSTMALYRKAYKTHFARIRSGSMTKEEFDAWKEDASQKRSLVEAGDLALDEYAAWLKK